MDAEELPEELSDSPEIDCCAEISADCALTACHWRCALAVIDELLAGGDDVAGDETDRLLDLRSCLRQRVDAESALRLFCELRVQMERRHYLAFFRIRRWIENHLVATVQPAAAGGPRAVRLKLDHYCFVAIRRACLCAGMAGGATLAGPRVAFDFRALSATSSPDGCAAAQDRGHG